MVLSVIGKPLNGVVEGPHSQAMRLDELLGFLAANPVSKH